MQRVRSHSDDQDSTSSNSKEEMNQGKMIHTLIDTLGKAKATKDCKKKAKRDKKKVKKAKIAATLGLLGAKQCTSKSILDAINETSQQGEAPKASNESVQIVTVVKPKVTLEDACNVLPKPMPLGCTALCQPLRGIISLSKLSTAQLRPHPY